MIDTGSSVDILFNHAYESMKHLLKNKLKPYNHNLYGFKNKLVQPWGIITLPLELGDVRNYMIHNIDFFVIDYWSPYNAILGRATQSIFSMVIS